MQLNRDGSFTRTRMNVDDARLRATIDAFVQSKKGISDSVDALGGAFVEVMQRYAPRDTGRYRRAWLEAGRMAGVWHGPMGSLKESRYAERYEDLLDVQLGRIDKQIEQLDERLELWFRSRGLNPNKSKGGRRMQSAARKLRKRRDTAARYLAEARQGGPYILIYGSSGRRSAKTGRIIGRRLTSIRTTVPGGSGSRLVSGSKALIRLENHEPHAFLVEKRTRAGRRSLGAARSLGLRRAGRAYLDTLNEERRVVAQRGAVGSRRGLSKGLAGRLTG